MRLVESLENLNIDAAYKIVFSPQFEELAAGICERFDLDEATEALDSEKARAAFYAKADAACLSSDYWNAIKDLCAKCDIPTRWEDFVATYVAFGEMDDGRNPDGLTMEIELGGRSPRFFLELNEKTSLADVKKKWKDISLLVRKHAGKSSAKRRPSKQLFRDHLIWELARGGKTIDEIWQIMRASGGQDLDYGNVKKIVSTFAKRMKAQEARKRFKLKTSHFPRRIKK